MVTRAQVALRWKVEHHPKCGDQPKAAAYLGVTQGAISHWASGFRKPDGDNRDVLEAKLDLPRSWWKEPYDSARHNLDGSLKKAA